MTIEWLAGNRIKGTSTERTVGTSGISLTGTQTTSGMTDTSLSVSINVGDHTNKALIVCVTQQSGSTTSVKVGSNSFTNVDIQNGAADGNGSQRTEIWYLLDSDITNNASNQIDWVGTAGSRVSIGVYSLNNVNQNTSGNFVSSSAHNTSSSYSNQPNGVVNSVDSGGFIIDILSANSSTQPTDTLTEGWNILISANRYAVSQYNASPSTNNNMFYSNIVAAEWAWSGVAIKPVTAIPALMPSLQSPSVGGWKELARTTLGSASSTIDVSSLPSKRYYMILGDLDKSVGLEERITFNGNTSGYASRRSINGETDTEPINQPNIEGTTAGGSPTFAVGYIANKSGKEKLMTQQEIGREATGVTTLFRYELVGKWANTDAINQITYSGTAYGSARNYDSGAEVVVLGWDDSDTHTDNFWEELASADWSSGGTIDTGTFTAKKYLWVQMSYQNTTSGFVYFNFNTDNTGTNYSSRYSENGGTDAVTVNYGNNESFYQLAGVGGGSTYSNGLINMFIMNNTADEKLVVSNCVQVRSDELGSGESPTTRREAVGKWINTSSQVTQIQLKKGSNSFSGGTIKVWGHD